MPTPVKSLFSLFWNYVEVLSSPFMLWVHSLKSFGIKLDVLTPQDKLDCRVRQTTLHGCLRQHAHPASVRDSKDSSGTRNSCHKEQERPDTWSSKIYSCSSQTHSPRTSLNSLVFVIEILNCIAVSQSFFFSSSEKNRLLLLYDPHHLAVATYKAGRTERHKKSIQVFLFRYRTSIIFQWHKTAMGRDYLNLVPEIHT